MKIIMLEVGGFSKNIWDEHSLTNTTFSVGFENKLSERFSFRTNLGSAWRTPNMAELYSFSSHGLRIHLDC